MADKRGGDMHRTHNNIILECKTSLVDNYGAPHITNR